MSRRPNLFPASANEPVDFRFFCEIGLDADGAAADFGNFGGYFPGIGLRLVKMDDDIGAVLRQVKCDGAAQALARTGNQGNLSSEVGGIRIGGRHRQLKKVAYSAVTGWQANFSATRFTELFRAPC